MDQGNTDPNNPNPIFPTQPVAGTPPPMPVAPADPATVPPVDQFMPTPQQPPIPAESSFSPPPATTGEPSWGNPAPVAAVADAPITPPETPPTAFNPFAAPQPESAASMSSNTTGTDTAPTDLNSLAGNSSEAINYVPQTDASPNMGAIQPESLVVAPTAPAESAQAVTATGAGGGFPKIIYVVAGVVLLIVIAASAYFIFGVGRSVEAPAVTSVPAVQKQPTIPPPTPTTPVFSSPSAGLPGSTSTSSAAPAGGTSAYDLLKQRQTTTPTPTPLK